MSKRVIIILSVLLILVNVFIFYKYALELSRYYRLVTSAIYLALLFAFKGIKENKIGLFFVLLVISDFFNIFYEVPISTKLTSFFKIGGYVFLSFLILDKLKFSNIKKQFLIAFAFLLSLNLIMAFYSVYKVSNKTNDVIELIMLLIYGAVLILSTALAANYNFRYISKRSTCFFYLVFAFVIGDISRFLAYYLNYHLIFYVDRVLYVIGLLCAMWYVLYTSEEEDVLPA